MSKIYGVSMMKDEVDVAAHTVRHMASERVDGIIVADNASTDGTFAALANLRSELRVSHPHLDFLVVGDGDPAYYQSRKMTALGQLAAERGATWIVPFDADELWYHPDEPLGDFLRSTEITTAVVDAELWNYFATGLDDPAVSNPFLRMIHRFPDKGALPKVALRWEDNAVILAGNHGVDLPRGGDRRSGLVVAHFPYRSFEQFASKVTNGSRAYALTDLSADTGAHWRQYGFLLESKGPEALRHVYDDWFHFEHPNLGYLTPCPAPFCRWAGVSA